MKEKHFIAHFAGVESPDAQCGDVRRAVKDTSNQNSWWYGVSSSDGGECDGFLSGLVCLIRCVKVGRGAEVECSQSVCQGFSRRKFVFLFFYIVYVPSTLNTEKKKSAAQLAL